MDEKYIPLSAAVAIIEAKQRELCPVGRFSRNAIYGSDRNRFDDLQETIDAIEAIEPADVRPVERSTWKRIDPPGYGYVCGKCGRWEPRPEPFCNCGADMRPEPGKEQANE